MNARIRPNFIRPRIRGFGATSNLATAGELATLTTASITAGSAIAAGAAAGSVVGPIGTAVGALAGIVAGLLQAKPNTAAHIGSWDSQLVNALAALPAPNGIGRQIPWNDDGHGLTQMIEALLATGLYMDWDTSIISNYDVCAHWATTFATLAQVVATAGCKGAAGASLTVSITSQPGGPVGPGNFTFKNPGIAGGPEAFAASAIMGASGAMTWLFNRWQIAGTAAQSKAYASQMGNNAYAQKVFALMVDYVAAQVAPAAAAPVTTPPKVSAVIPAASTAAKTAVAAAPTTAAKPATTTAPATATTQPVTVPTTPTPVATTSSGSTVSDADIANLIAQVQAQGQSQNAAISAALAQLQSQGVNTAAPAVQAAVSNAVAPAGPQFSTTDILIGVAALGGLVYFLTKK
jgi:hypothetical protein